jgi:hypothetical protein
MTKISVRRSTFALLLASMPIAACDCGDALAPVSGSAALSGVVCDEATGLPVEGRDLRFEHDEVDRVVSARTDGAGNFLMEQLVPGTGRLVIAMGGIARREAVELLEDQTTLWRDPSCRPGPLPGGLGGIDGKVCNRHVGEWVVQAQVTVPLADGTSLQTVTAEDGYFSLADVPSGLREVHVTAPGFSRSFLVEVNDGEVTEMGLGEICEQGDGSSGYVTGAFCDPGYHGALAGADVRVVDAAGEEHVDVTDLGGEFLVGPMPAGGALVHLSRPPDVDESISVTVLAGEDAVVDAPWGCGGFGPPGGIEGRLCSPNGEFWLEDARVWIDTADGEHIETRTDSEGRFALDGVPPGQYVLYVAKGSFQGSFDVVVEEDKVTVLPEDQCEIVIDNTRIAVVEGSFDHMETVLQNLGIGSGITDIYPAGWESALLADYTALSEYDVVIINCGAPEDDYFYSALYADNLKQWINEGGSLYASDWAYDIVEHLFSQKIDFLGDDLTRDAAQDASNTGDEVASVVDTGLAQSLGQYNVTVKLWAPWAIMESVASDVRVFIRGPAETYTGYSDGQAPYTVGFSYGAGEVIYTSWHQEPGINVDAERALQLLVFEL